MGKRKISFLIFVLATFILLISLILSNFLTTKKYTLINSGLTREYLAHLPYNYNTLKDVPLVIALHGYGDGPKIMEFYSGWSRLADKEGFMVVYPAGTNDPKDKKLSWNGGSCCGAGVLKNTDDIGFINNLVDELSKNYKIDKSKIFLTGFSNGALLAYAIAAKDPGKFAAISINSASIGGKVYKKLHYYNTPVPTKPLSMLIFHGMQDDIIPYNGGQNQQQNGEFKSFKESVDFWTENGKCKLISQSEDNIKTNQKYECSGGKVIETYLVKNGKHVWFGSILEAVSMFTGKTISTTNLSWDFFKKIN